ncbi:MAG: response regulator, partial [Acidobacteria bacterium]|nr:response regulator [Candidatus Sulfomarinibacter kjeldsenii]
FLANMSHELRTPMNAIIGYSEMLAEEAEDDGLDDMIPDLKKINAAGNHLLALINDILDLSKIEAGRMDLYLERFDVRQMLAEAVDTVTPLIAKNDNRLVTDFGDDIGSIRADLTKLRQSLFNLLSNAAKFTEGGTVTLAVKRDPRESGDWIELSVSDTGIGIREEMLDHVFEEFSQADDSTSRDYGGTGLGLPISRRFCQMMGGDISVSSEHGIGSTFTIELPAQVDALEAAKASAQIDAGEGRSVEGDRPPILVIDDDQDSRELLQRTLEADGHSVVTAADGEEGLELARRLHPILITLDVMMPGLDGWAVLKELKADPDLHRIPVMMVTIESQQDLGYSLGAVEHLTKPVNRGQLLQLVSRYTRAESGTHALVVDDDEGIRDLFGTALSEAGWTVDEARDGAKALECVSLRAPDIVLLDLMMPVMNGFEFLFEFRRQKDFRSVPVIVVTAKDLTDDERLLLNGGMVRIVKKGGLNREQLLEQVREFVAKHSTSRDAEG